MVPQTTFSQAFAATANPGIWESHVAPFLEKHWRIFCLCLVGIACARIMGTYSALSLTVDEPTHLACGLEYLAKHVYRLETQHPPLSRMLEALGPYVAGARPVGEPVLNIAGLSSIAGSGSPDRAIFLMRLGNLPFFVLACVVVCAWCRHTFDRATAVVATGLFTLLPSVLADAGLATTDMALAANVAAAYFAGVLWAEKPTWQRSTLLGLFVGLACLSKFTALGFLPAAAGLALALYLGLSKTGWLGLGRVAKKHLMPFAFAVAIAALLIWAGYWFSVGSARMPYTNISVTVPAPEFLDGIRSALNHNRAGHSAFLLGEYRMTGWWYYFLVALAVKTPIPFLALSVLGACVCVQRRKHLSYLLPVAFSLGVLLPSMRSHLDIGIRHVEAAYVGLAIVSAVGFTRLLQWTHGVVTVTVTAGLLVAWLVIPVALHHPDYLAYFNEFAGNSPEKVLVDSNYDWGQDMKLLGSRLHQLGVKEFSLASAVDAGMSAEQRHDYLESWYDLPTIHDANICRPAPGWNVISTTVEQSSSKWPGSRFYRGPQLSKAWYEKTIPNDRLGALLLYHISPTLTFHSEGCP